MPTHAAFLRGMAVELSHAMPMVVASSAAVASGELSSVGVSKQDEVCRAKCRDAQRSGPVEIVDLKLGVAGDLEDEELLLCDGDQVPDLERD